MSTDPLVPPPSRPHSVVLSDNDTLAVMNDTGVYIMDCADVLCGSPFASSRQEVQTEVCVRRLRAVCCCVNPACLAGLCHMFVIFFKWRCWPAAVGCVHCCWRQHLELHARAKQLEHCAGAVCCSGCFHENRRIASSGA